MLDFAINYSCPVDRAWMGYGGIIFSIIVIFGTALFLYLFSKSQKRFLYHYFAMMIGVFIFEMFTSPLWNNPHLGKYAYVYQDVSWVLTLGWSTLMLSVIMFVDRIFIKTVEYRRLAYYLVTMSLVGFLAESAMVYFGLRTYASEIKAALWGPMVWNVPIEVFYYIPVMSVLVIGFYKYWGMVIDGIPVVPEKCIRWGRALALTVSAVLLFELMVEPMVTNMNLPTWSYVYRDISIIMTGIWVFVLLVSIKLVDIFFSYWSMKQRFGAYLLAVFLIATPIESWYMIEGYRVYGESAMRDFIGLYLPVFHLPVEVVFAIPMYFALMIASIRYWEIIGTSKKIP